MAASIEVDFCNLCQQSPISPKAVEFCPECQVYLCSNCKMHHGISILFKLHTTIPIQEYQMLPSCIKSITPFCEKHEQRLDLYCFDHLQPCCIRCLSQHKNCTEISPLVDSVKDIKNSTLSVDLEQSVNDLTNFIEKIHNVLEQNKNEIINQKRSILDQIRVAREQIITRIDSLEQNIIDTLSTSIKKYVQEIDSLLQEIDVKKTWLLQMNEDWETTKKYASDFQAFLGVRKLESDIEKEEQYLKSLSTNGSLDSKKVELVPKMLNNSTLDVSIFGDIRISNISTDITLIKAKDKQAQIGATVSMSFDSINLTMNRRMLIERQPWGNHINGCTKLPNGDFVLVETGIKYRHRVISVTGGKEAHVTLWECLPNCALYDVCLINENTLAISGCHFYNSKLFIVDYNTKTILNILETANSYESITCNGNMIIGMMSDGIYTTDLESGCTEIIIPSTSSYQIRYVTLFKEMIYATNSDRYVVCWNMSGKVQWEIKNETIFKEPQGIAVDNHGNVFVADEASESVVVVSPCGSHCRQVLNKTDGLSKPRSLYFDSRDNCLIVCNSCKDVFVYKITYI